MDGTLMNRKLEASNQLSEKSWKTLLEYFENNTLTLQERCSLLNEITGHKDMLMERSFKD
jgi:effector-binding domain-containing protein